MIGTIVFPLVAMFSGLPLIGWANPVPVDMRNLHHPRRDFAIVALAGPVSNLLLAVAGALLLNGVYDRAEPLGVAGPAVVLVRFVVINVLLAVFNMIPIPPLDGGNVLMGLVPESAARVIDQLRPWGFLLLYALMLTGMLYTIVSPVQNVILDWLL
jgi:Zn-dependent protease